MEETPSACPRVVANSSVLIHLSRISMFELLKELYETLAIPRAVYREVVERGRGLPGSQEVEEATMANWIKVWDIRDRDAVKRFMKAHGLHLADAEVVCLAIEAQALLVLADELRLRKALIRLGFDVKGCMGIIIEAAGRGLISTDDAEAYINRLLMTDYRVNSRLINEVRLRLRELRRARGHG